MEKNVFFSTDMVEEKSRTDFWRATSIMVYDVTPRDGALAGSCQSHLLGPMMIGTSGFNKQNFTRSRSIIAQSGLDFFTIGLALSGASQGDYNGTDVSLQQGDILIHDLSQPSIGQTETGARLCIAADRASIQKLVPNKNIHGMVLSGRRAITRILAQYMIGLDNTHTDIDKSDVLAAQEAFLTLLASAIKGADNSNIINDHAINMPLKQRIIDYINANIENPVLGTNSIMKFFGISRSNLYRLFEAEDGVAKFIRDRRLDMAYQLLGDRRIKAQPHKTILYRYGFSDNSRFTHHFKNRFGMLPREVRAVKALPNKSQPGMARFQEYLRGLSLTTVQEPA